MKATIKTYELPQYTPSAHTCMKSSASLDARLAAMAAASTYGVQTFTNIDFTFGSAPVLALTWSNSVGWPTYLVAVATLENGTALDRSYGYFVTGVTAGNQSKGSSNHTVYLTLQIDGMFYLSAYRYPMILDKIVANVEWYTGLSSLCPRFDVSQFNSDHDPSKRAYYEKELADDFIKAIDVIGIPQSRINFPLLARQGWIITCRKTPLDNYNGYDQPINGLYYYINPYRMQIYASARTLTGDVLTNTLNLWTEWNSMPDTFKNDDNTMWCRWVPYLPSTYFFLGYDEDLGEEWQIDPWRRLSGTSDTMGRALSLRTSYFAKELISATDLIANDYAMLCGLSQPYIPIGNKSIFLTDGISRLAVSPLYDELCKRSATGITAERASIKYEIEVSSMIQDAIIFDFPASTRYSQDRTAGFAKPLKLSAYYLDIKSDSFLAWKRQNEANLALTTSMSAIGSMLTIVGGIASANPILAIGGVVGLGTSIGNMAIAYDRASKVSDAVKSGQGDNGFQYRCALGLMTPYIEVQSPITDPTTTVTDFMRYNMDPLPIKKGWGYESLVSTTGALKYYTFFIKDLPIRWVIDRPPIEAEIRDILTRGAQGLTYLSY